MFRKFDLYNSVRVLQLIRVLCTGTIKLRRAEVRHVHQISHILKLASSHYRHKKVQVVSSIGNPFLTQHYYELDYRYRNFVNATILAVIKEEYWCLSSLGYSHVKCLGVAWGRTQAFPSVALCVTPNSLEKIPTTSSELLFHKWVHLQIIEDQACAENIRINTNKVWPLRINYHLDSLTAQGKVVLL